MTKDLSLIWLLFKHFGICPLTSVSIFEEVLPPPPPLLSSVIRDFEIKVQVGVQSLNPKIRSQKCHTSLIPRIALATL